MVRPEKKRKLSEIASLLISPMLRPEKKRKLSEIASLLISPVLRPEKKRKLSTTKTNKRPLEPESSPNPSLPDDLVVTILASVSRLYYTNLSLVSKSFRSLLASPGLYQTRTLLSRTETFFYVCLRFPDEANPRWFTLYRKPNQTTKKNLLAPTLVHNSPPVEWSSFIAVGSNIYGISSAIEDSPCSNVWFLDCRTNTWLESPRMRLAHTNSESDGNVYLAGSSETPDSLSCVEVYNTMAQTWNPVPPQKRIWKPENTEGKVYLNIAGHAVALKPKDFTWEVVGSEIDLDCSSLCRIGNITYHYDPNVRFRWRNNKTKGAVWRTLPGLEELPKFADYTFVKLADYGGKLVVLWDKYVSASGYKERMIWCAEISIEKRNSAEIWGKIEWFDAVLTVPESFKFVCAKSVTV